MNHASGKRGRPSKFRPEFVEQVRRIRQRFDATTDDVAEVLSVDASTVREWVRKRPDFRLAMQSAPLKPGYRIFGMRAAKDALAAMVEASARRNRLRLPADIAGAAAIRAVIEAALSARHIRVGSETN